jgi:two-component system alkaline phosphatase synthesis response regulator PhoP
VDGQKQAPATVLVVDDEPILQETIKFNLQREGFTVLLAGDGESALEIARQTAPDLIVLDIMLPVLDGLQVLRILREESTVPILLLSARGEEIDRVLGLELGADDYLSKPFAMRELVARVRAMMRRARMAQDDVSREATALESPRGVITAGELTIDPSARQVRANGVLIDLKPKEFDLLLYLARHPGIVLTRDALLREVWGYDFPVDTRTIDVHIRGVRQKIEQASGLPALIETVRGYGCRFVDTHARV